MTSITTGSFPCPCAACKASPSPAGISQALAAHLNAMETLIAGSITVTSGRRCPAHNAAIGGAPDSQHLQGMAADIATDTSSAAYALVKAAFAVGVPFIEVAPHHVHIDLRPGPARLITGAG